MNAGGAEAGHRSREPIVVQGARLHSAAMCSRDSFDGRRFAPHSYAIWKRATASLLKLLLVLGFAFRFAGNVHGEALERLRPERLRATHQRVVALEKERRPVTLESGYRDVRAAVHVHSSLSHDSRGTLDEITAAAKRAGVRAILFTEHPADNYDYFADGHQGEVGGVLLIPGAETEGFLAFPTRSVQRESTDSPQAFANLVRRDGGLVFLSHLEERMDWQITHLTGCEIYNTHADFKDETQFITALKNPLTLLNLAASVREYPQEAFAAIEDYPADYLRRFDELCQHERLTGVAANDAHHNQSFHARIAADGKLVLDDALGKTLFSADLNTVPLIRPFIGDKQPGDLLFELDLDPYERSFRHVSTHLFMKDVTHNNVWDALAAGRAYVAFDWMGDPTGFAFRADHGERSWAVGSEVLLRDPSADEPGLRLRAAAPLAGTIKLVRNGRVIMTRETAEIDEPIDEPGVYRVEWWITFAGEPRPWILSNPIYVRAATK